MQTLTIRATPLEAFAVVCRLRTMLLYSLSCRSLSNGEYRRANSDIDLACGVLFLCASVPVLGPHCPPVPIPCRSPALPEGRSTGFIVLLNHIAGANGSGYGERKKPWRSRNKTEYRLQASPSYNSRLANKTMEPNWCRAIQGGDVKRLTGGVLEMP
jgi:hypothetical protein